MVDPSPSSSSGDGSSPICPGGRTGLISSSPSSLGMPVVALRDSDGVPVGSGSLLQIFLSAPLAATSEDAAISETISEQQVAHSSSEGGVADPSLIGCGSY